MGAWGKIATIAARISQRSITVINSSVGAFYFDALSLFYHTPIDLTIAEPIPYRITILI